MSEQLYKVVKEFEATEVESGSSRIFGEDEELLAEDPLNPVDGVVTFEADNAEFQVAYQTFINSAVPKELDELIEATDTVVVPLPGCRTCGHQRARHNGIAGRCTAVDDVNNQPTPCTCEAFN